MELKARLQKFLDELGVPVTVLSSKISLSPQSLYDWRKGKLRLSEKTLNRLDEYLKKYNF